MRPPGTQRGHAGGQCLPYKNAPESTNGFLAAAAEYTANGCYVMNWATNFQPNVDAYRATLVAALNQYRRWS